MATDSVISACPIRQGDGTRRDDGIVNMTERQFQTVYNLARRVGLYDVSLGRSFDLGEARTMLAPSLRRILALEGLTAEIRAIVADIIKLASRGDGLTFRRGMRYERVGGGSGRVAKPDATSGDAEAVPPSYADFVFRPRG